MPRIDARAPALEFSDHLMAGQVPGHGGNRKFGARLAVPTAQPVPVWTGTDVANEYPGFITAAEAVVVNSGNLADDVAGANARTVCVQGLDENWEPATETVPLVGAGASAATTTTFIRVNRAFVDTVGTYKVSNLAAITVTGNVSGAELAHIPAGAGQTQMAIWAVPAGKVGVLHGGFLNYDSGKNLAALNLWVRENTDPPGTAPIPADRLIQTIRGVAGGTTIPINLDGTPQTFPERTDVWFEAQADTTPGDIEVNAFFHTIPA